MNTQDPNTNATRRQTVPSNGSVFGVINESLQNQGLAGRVPEMAKQQLDANCDGRLLLTYAGRNEGGAHSDHALAW
jgi:hypothetical protein